MTLGNDEIIGATFDIDALTSIRDRSMSAQPSAWVTSNSTTTTDPEGVFLSEFASS